MNQQLLDQQLLDRIEALRRDYADNDPGGRPFRFFHCPILGVDEDVPLQKGHVINKAFVDSDRAWVPQRKDVDSFYGSHFEAEFELIQYRDAGPTSTDILADCKLSHKLRPGFYRDGERVSHFPLSKAPPPDVTPVIVHRESGRPVAVALKMLPEEFLASVGRTWETGYDVNVGLPMLVSAIKAAHLSAFYVFGYGYALGAAGLFIGPDVLGKFYRDARGLSREEIRGRARGVFREFVHAVRPVLGFDGVDFRGTISDQHVFACRGSSGSIWGIMVFLRTAHLRHAIILPAAHSGDSVAAYLDFLSNDNETIHVSTGRYDKTNRQFECSPGALPMHWPKKNTHLD